MEKRCRHERNSWIIGTDSYEWCYVCGAFRKLKTIGTFIVVPASKWVVPTGNKKDVPYIVPLKVNKQSKRV